MAKPRRCTKVRLTLEFLVDGDFKQYSANLMQTPGAVECLGEFETWLAGTFDPLILRCKSVKTKVSRDRAAKLLGYANAKELDGE